MTDITSSNEPSSDSKVTSNSKSENDEQDDMTIRDFIHNHYMQIIESIIKNEATTKYPFIQERYNLCKDHVPNKKPFLLTLLCVAAKLNNERHFEAWIWHYLNIYDFITNLIHAIKCTEDVSIELNNDFAPEHYIYTHDYKADMSPNIQSCTHCYKKYDINTEWINEVIIQIRLAITTHVVFTKSHVFIKMPYYGDIELTDIKRLDLPLKLRYSMFLQLIEDLKEVHKNRVVHRDIKPSNIMVYGIKLKLIDWGHSTPMNNILQYTNQTTFWYSPPECFNNQYTTEYIDHWSMGCVLYFLITYKHLFVGARDDIDRLDRNYIKNMQRRRLRPDHPKMKVFQNIPEEIHNTFKNLMRFTPHLRTF